MTAVTQRGVAPGTGAAAIVTSPGRLEGVDLLRGVVMVLMVLDHTREFFTDQHVDSTDLDTVSAALFLTRWVSHFCAPVFVLLAGTSSYLALATGKFPTHRALAGYLAVRGIVLMVLELTLVRLGWNFNLDYSFVLLQVIWAIGLAMICLSVFLAIGLGSREIGLLGLTLIAGHNLLETAVLADLADTLKGWNWAWTILLRPGGIVLEPVRIQVAYPLLPWFGVMAVGFAFGEVLTLAPATRRRITLGLGCTLVASFVLLRAFNTYGDPTPWKVHDAVHRTILSFLNCQKYPPSLQYLFMTLGPGLVLLSVFLGSDGASREVGRPVLDASRRILATFGRVPLFYYLIQWPVVHVLASATGVISGQSVNWFVWSFDYPPGYGYNLSVVYAMWALTIALIYFPCRWFAAYKRRHRDVAWLAFF
ncbi:MAG: heparan-alpha-glucosaminide N-acetyltransferase domain-containing protein [Isosphaeraceae bacterium]